MGGLLTPSALGDSGFGLTVAHASDPSDVGENATPHDLHMETAICDIVQVASDLANVTGTPCLDWALIKFDEGIRLHVTEPPPTAIASRPTRANEVSVRTPRGSIRGTLSTSLTYINLEGGPMSLITRSVVINQPICTSVSI